MTRRPLFGLGLAAAGALFLTPDAMFMRLSGMDGFQMAAWRGLLMGAVLLSCWAATSRDRRGDLGQLVTGAGLAFVACHLANATMFSLAIAAAPAAVVLVGVATVPVFSALLSRLVLGEPTQAATWAAMAAVITGVAIAVWGGEAGAPRLDPRAVLGAALGLGVALVLAFNFVILRARPGLPILLVIGCGALASGLNGLVITGPEHMAQGRLWAIGISGAVILPVSFLALSLASRHTQAANVSLLMLLETVLGPLWVWYGVGERPGPPMIVGAALVVTSLAVYLWVAGRGLTPAEPPG